MLTPDLSIVCVADRPEALRVLIACLRVQTCPSWELIVLDQTPRAGCLREVEEVEARGERRVLWHHVPRVGDWGQTVKFEAARDVARGTFVCFPCDDAYYVPHFVERMLWHARNERLDLVYCNFLWNVADYQPMVAAPAVSRVDIGGFIVKRQAVIDDGWTNRSDTGDGLLVERLAAKVPHGLVPERVLYIKN